VVYSQAVCLDEWEIFGRMVERPSALCRQASMQGPQARLRPASAVQRRRADWERCLVALMVAEPRALSRPEDALLADARSQELPAWQQGAVERSSGAERRAKRQQAPLPKARPAEGRRALEVRSAPLGWRGQERSARASRLARYLALALQELLEERRPVEPSSLSQRRISRLRRPPQRRLNLGNVFVRARRGRDRENSSESFFR
jgi:hypothetical protein